MTALSISGISGLWLVRGTILFPLVSGTTHPVFFGLSIAVGIIAAMFSWAVVLGGVLCVIRDRRETIGRGGGHCELSTKETPQV